MATAPIYCTHKELKRVYPQIDAFDTKTPIYGWEVESGDLYVSKNCGLVTQLFADGRDLGAAQGSSGACGSNGKWYYDSDLDEVFYYATSAHGIPADKLMEAGEEFTAMITQFRTDASRYLDSKLDPNLPREQLKDKSGNFDYMIIRSSALIAAAFLIRATDPTNEIATALMEEAQGNIDALNSGGAALSWQTTRDASRGIIRDVIYTDGKIRPVDTRGMWGGTFDLIKVKIAAGGVLGVATYNVWVKDADNLKQTQVVTEEKINGDYQALAGGLQIRFAGTDVLTRAEVDDEWEIEVTGVGEHIDASGVKSVANSRWLN
jgi:hypothetical protein